jgi:hypothetical protein
MRLGDYVAKYVAQPLTKPPCLLAGFPFVLLSAKNYHLSEVDGHEDGPFQPSCHATVAAASVSRYSCKLGPSIVWIFPNPPVPARSVFILRGP